MEAANAITFSPLTITIISGVMVTLIATAVIAFVKFLGSLKDKDGELKDMIAENSKKIELNSQKDSERERDQKRFEESLKEAKAREDKLENRVNLELEKHKTLYEERSSKIENKLSSIESVLKTQGESLAGISATLEILVKK